MLYYNMAELQYAIDLDHPDKGILTYYKSSGDRPKLL